MKRSSLSFFTALLASALLLPSCVRDVVLDAGDKPAVVVECILKNSDVQELHLNFTKGASKSDHEPLTEAVATLYDLTVKRAVGQFVRQDGDLWTLDYTPVPYHDYRLEVEVPGHDLIYAEDTMPGKVEVCWGRKTASSLFTEYNFTEYDNGDFSKYELEFYRTLKRRYPDKTGTQCFLAGSFYYLVSAPHPFLIYGMNLNPVTEDYEFVEFLCTDHPSVQPYTLSSGTYVSPSIRDDYPKVKLYPLLEGQPLYNRYMIFPENADKSERMFTISGSFKGMWWNYYKSAYDDEYPRGYLVVVSMSSTYRRYLEDVIVTCQLKDSSDLTAVYVRDNIYSNMEGGVGLFAGVYETKEEWCMRYTLLEAWEMFWEVYESDPEFYAEAGSVSGGANSLIEREYINRYIIGSGDFTDEEIEYAFH